TVNYALGTSKFLLSQSDLKVDSPYNTYLHTGLPPTPINSPGKAALLAALHPAQGNYLYFVTTDPVSGETTFTASRQEFEKLRAQVQAAYAASASASASP
ncbi:MAG: endolytic transglycosylase MltG, partial [Acidothermus sp.]|nr:endolytic transglycosylase MltG [Acidothermus sp.]